jgi:aryl carrier-like protein
VEDCSQGSAADAGGALRAVFHLAGSLADGAFELLTPQAFGHAFDAKVNGARVLASAVRGRFLDAFALFGSASSVLGSAGQANYAAASGCLTGLAQQLRASGVPATCVAWGPWVPEGGGGMAAAVGERDGVRALTDDQAGRVIDVIRNWTEPMLLSVAADWDQYARQSAGTPRERLVAELVISQPRSLVPASAARAGSAPAASARDDAARDGAAGWLRSAGDLDDTLRTAIRSMVADVLGDDTADIDDETELPDLGLDSIMGIDLRNRVAHAVGTELPATMTIDHPTVASLAEFVARSVRPGQQEAS